MAQRTARMKDEAKQRVQFRKRLRTWRIDQGIALEGVARTVNRYLTESFQLDKYQLSKLETIASPSPEWLEALAKAYPTLSVNWLVTGEGSMLDGTMSPIAPLAQPIPASAPTPPPNVRQDLADAMVEVVYRGGVSFDRSFIKTVIELGMQGETRPKIARALQVPRDTLNEWEEQIPQFKLAMQYANDLALAYWTDIIESGISGKLFNEKAYRSFMATHFPNDYKAEPPKQLELKGLLGQINVNELDDATLALLASDPMTAVINILSKQVPQLTNGKDVTPE